ncbi:MAG TPA: GNAT family N-acetyltransferase [Roseimicrobium sp.]|nr:GNAT family N-acetyltransferase [Roseimicrobium sp.]
MAIRPYTEMDWVGVCRIHDAARLLELAAGGVDPRAFRPMTEAAEVDEFFDSVTVVACLDDRIVGFVSWNGAYITWLYVDPSAQRRGIGRRLLEHAMGQIGPEAWTNTIAGNEPALALYRAAGFEIVWEQRGDCDGYPCTAMRLALPTCRMRDPDARRQPPAT